MSIQRLPHPIYSTFWIARYLAIIGFLAFFSPLWLFVAVVSFVPVETLAIHQKTKFRDQLSEIWTWALRKVQPDASTILGWNLMAPVFAAVEMAAVHALLAHSAVVPDPYIYLITVPTWLLLSLHWWRPQGIGSWWPKT